MNVEACPVPRRKNSLLWLCTGMLCLGFAMQPTARADGQAAKTRHASLLSALEALRSRNDISAAALAIVDLDDPDNELVTGLGHLSHGSKEQINGDTVFRLGSITKSFTSLTLMRLEPGSRIALEDRLDQHVDPGLWKNRWTPAHPVTLAGLLEHSAGFTDISKAEFDSNKPLSLEVALKHHSSRHQVRWQPGQWSSYSNLGAGLVGLAMQKAADENYEELVQRLLLVPLGMEDSGFGESEVRVTGYDRDGRRVIPYWHMVYRPFGALNATASDMARYVRWHLQKGRWEGKALLSEELMQRSERPDTTLAARAGLEFGYGLGNYAWLSNGFLFHGHGGDADGYLSRFAYSHELGKGYFLVINAFNGSALRAMRRLVEQALAEEHSPAPKPGIIPLDKEKHGWIEGDYELKTWRFGKAPTNRYRFELSGNRILYRSANDRKTLYAVSGDENRLLLRYPQQNRATAVIARDADGFTWFVDDSLNLEKQ